MFIKTSLITLFCSAICNGMLPPTPLLDALAHVESHQNMSAYRADADAAGILQIRPCVLQDVNNHLGFQAYTELDRWQPARSYEVCRWYLTKWALAAKRSLDLRDLALTWRKGPSGPWLAWTPACRSYWASVRAHIWRPGRWVDVVTPYGVTLRLQVKNLHGDVVQVGNRLYCARTLCGYDQGYSLVL